MVKVFGNFIHDTIICRVQLSFGSAIVKIYPFTILCWVNEDKKTCSSTIKFSQPVEHYMSHSY